MKIAIASDSGLVSQHFGRCSEYRIFDIQGKEAAGETTLKNPGHEPGLLPRLLASQGIDCIIAGGMGPSAMNLFRQNGIEVVTGASGRVEDVVKAYIDGRLELHGSSCEHRE